MKKLAYIILVIAILLLISHFVKNGMTPAEEPVVAEETVATVSTPAVSETATPSEDSDVVNVQGTAEVDAPAASETAAEDIIISDDVPEDDGAIDVVETSEATMDEEETVLPE